MVLVNGKDKIAFENLDIEKMSYADLQAIKAQLTLNLRAVKNQISDMEMNQEYDDQILAWCQSEVDRVQAEAEME